MRALWKGSISFGLVNIPVGLYSAIKAQKTIDFDLLRDTDHSPIHYKRVAEADGKEVPREHIVKGYQYEKNRYVVLTDEDFQRVQIPSTQTVDIVEFVNLADIEPRFFEASYFLAPEKNGAKAYTLLRDALEETGKAGIAKVVIRPPREHLALVMPLDGILMLETMHFVDELRDPSEVKAPGADVTRKEREMATALIKSLSAEWHPGKYHDQYREALMDVIQKKIKAGGKELPAPKPRKRAAPKRVVDLVSILQESLAQASRGGAAPKRQRKKAA
jgi:DNA end-binding protein Ku